MIEVGDRVRKTTGDYRFEGEVRTIFELNHGREDWRVAVRHDDGWVFIFRLDQVEPTRAPYIEDVQLPPWADE